jgi:hypothetical protein
MPRGEVGLALVLGDRRLVGPSAQQEVSAWPRERAAMEPGAPAEGAAAFRTGAVSMIQRFGSSLALNPHLHALIPDGAWVRRRGGALAFVPVSPPTDQDVEALVVQIEECCEQVLARLGFGAEDEQDEPDPEDAQALLQAASLAGVAALGRRAGGRARRETVHGGRTVKLPARCAACEGYNLHAGVRVAGRDRTGLEHLCRYIARPPLGLPWAALLWRLFEKNALACSRCGRPMRLRTVVLPPASLAILADLDAAAARAPPLVA